MMTVQMEREVDYVEEENLGLDLQPVAFCPLNRRFFAVSRNHVLSYDVTTGKRLKLFTHSEPVIGVYFVGKMFITITKSGSVTQWDAENGRQIAVGLPARKANLLYSYGVNSSERDDANETVDIYVYGEKSYVEPMETDDAEATTNSTAPNASTAKMSLYRLDLIFARGEGAANIDVNLAFVVELDTPILSKRHLAVGANFLALVAARRQLKIVALSHCRGGGGGKISGPTTFTQKMSFNKRDATCIAIDEIHVLDDSVFIAMNLGRIYFWNRVRECGLGHTNKTYLDVGPTSFTMAVGNSRVAYTGDGRGQLVKWNLTTTGVGRVARGEYLGTRAPVERLHVGADASLLAAVVADNSAYVVRTADMAVQAMPQVLNWNTIASPLSWAGLRWDSAQPEFVLTNGTLGHLQWIDPFKWRTVNQFDVTGENSPWRDHYNMPEPLWSNVYLAHATTAFMVTCECRRNDSEKSYMKIFRRVTCSTVSEFRLEECVECPRRVLSIRSNREKIANASRKERVEHEQIMRVMSDGRVDVFVPDVCRVGRWRIDINRERVTWRRSRVLDCSAIHADSFATVNEVGATIARDATDATLSHTSDDHGSGAEQSRSGGRPASGQSQPGTPKKKPANGRKGARFSASGNNDDASSTSIVDPSATDEADENQLDKNSSRRYVLVWQFPTTLKVTQIVDGIPDAKQIEWIRPADAYPAMLLIGAESAVCGYNPRAAAVLWRVDRPGMRIFSSRLTYFVYNSNTVVFFNERNGDVTRLLRFRTPQTQVIACGTSKNICLIGISPNGISVLKPDLPRNSLQGVLSSGVLKKTPFSELIGSTTTTGGSGSISTFAMNGFMDRNDVNSFADTELVRLEAKAPKASVIFDGPAHTLAPLTQLAPIYIANCLAVRQ